MGTASEPVTSPAGSAEPADPASAASMGDMLAGAGRMPSGAEPVGANGDPGRAADADTGFPQSMQKRDAGSFSRPQKAQVVRELTAGWGRPCNANIRRAKERRQQRAAARAGTNLPLVRS